MHTPSLLWGGAAGAVAGAAAGALVVMTAGGALIGLSPTPGPAAPSAPQAARGPLPASFAPIIKRVLPAVVSVHVLQAAPAPPGLAQLGVAAQIQEGLGSGFLISADGYVVTNYHVAGEAQRIAVTLSDGRQLPARLVGRDQATDLALLKVDARGLPSVAFATDAEPQVGDWVIAVGSPFGLGGTATAGIVSAHSRDIGQPWVSYVQLDAPINRGNSGGPTFDLAGRVIGVNTAIFSPSGGSVGIGFAIPASVAEHVVRQLRSHGRVMRGYIGATVAVDTPPGAPPAAASPRGGALIASVEPGSPAAAAGLQVGDVVIQLNQQPVHSGLELMRMVAEVSPGDPVRVTAVRGGRQLTVSARAAERPG